MVAIVLGAFVAAAVGAVLGLPVIRLPGIYAALATLAFALMFEGVLVPLTWVSGGNGTLPLTVPRPVMFGIDFANDKAFLLLVCVLLSVLGIGTIAVRQGITGRFLDAVRGTETAAAAVGISATRQRLVVFILGAGIAGFGGGLMASYYRQANYAANFTFVVALVWVVLVITAGSRLVQAAVTSGITFFILPELLTKLFTWLNGYWSVVNPSWAIGVAFILFGFGAFTYAKHPEGIIEAQTTASIQKTVDFFDRFRRTPATPPTTAAHRALLRPAVRAPRPTWRAHRAAHPRGRRAMTAMLEAIEVSKRFSGIAALVDVSLEVGDRELVGLIGPNGAGKTTLFNCLAGVIDPDGGKVRLDGQDLGGMSPHRRARLGIARTFQRIELFAGLIVRQHLLVADRAQHRARRAAARPDRADRSRRPRSAPGPTPCSSWWA